MAYTVRCSGIWIEAPLSIWCIIVTNRFKVGLQNCELHQGIILAIHLPTRRYEWNLITLHMGKTSARILIPRDMTAGVSKTSESINPSYSIVWINKMLYRTDLLKGQNRDSIFYTGKLIQKYCDNKNRSFVNWWKK